MAVCAAEAAALSAAASVVGAETKARMSMAHPAPLPADSCARRRAVKAPSVIPSRVTNLDSTPSTLATAPSRSRARLAFWRSSSVEEPSASTTRKETDATAMWTITCCCAPGVTDGVGVGVAVAVSRDEAVADEDGLGDAEPVPLDDDSGEALAEEEAAAVMVLVPVAHDDEVALADLEPERDGTDERVDVELGTELLVEDGDLGGSESVARAETDMEGDDDSEGEAELLRDGEGDADCELDGESVLRPLALSVAERAALPEAECAPDPLADGGTIAKASEGALKNGLYNRTGLGSHRRRPSGLRSPRT